MAIEKVRMEQVTDDLGNTTILHPETSSDNVLHMGSTLNKLMTLNGVSQPNFNFIPSKVVQEGLVSGTNTYLNLTQPTTIQLQIDANGKYGTIYLINNTWQDAYYLRVTSTQFIQLGAVATTLKLKSNYMNELIIKFYKGYVDIILNGIKERIPYDIVVTRVDTQNLTNFTIKNQLVYNKDLMAKDIQHNFTVLGNEESVNALQVADKKLLLNVDEDHVEMATGRTWREEYMSLLKQHGKEVVSTGGAITVNNGIKGRVISGEIKGQTVKNEMYAELYTDKSKYNPFNGTILANNVFEMQKVAWSTIRSNKDGIKLSPNTKYTLICEVLENTNTKVITAYDTGSSLSAFTTATTIINAGYVGIKKFLLTSKSDLTNTSIVNIVSENIDGIFKIRLMLIEGDWTNKDIGFFTGLGSTQVIINNNGQSYPIYEPTIQGTATGLAPTIVFSPVLPTLVTGDKLDLATRVITFANATTRQLTEEEMKAYLGYKKVILLNKVGDMADTFEIKEDGSSIWSKTIGVGVLNGNEPKWIKSTSTDSILQFVYFSSVHNIKASTCCIQDTLPSRPLGGWNPTVEGIVAGGTNADIVVFINASRLETPDAQGFIKWLKNNPTTFYYQLTTPIVTTIDKSIMPTIQVADKINICQVESPVAPSSLTLTLPTSDNIRKEFAVVLLNGYTKVAGSFTPRVALTQDNRVEISLDVTSPATFYPTIFSIDASIRPSTDIKVNGFVDNISTPITIKTTGEVVLPNTVVSKNVYIKEYYRLGVM